MRPAKVRVFGKVYDVQYVTGGPVEEDELGDCNYSLQRISIRDGLGFSEERSTVLHEVLHCIEAALNVMLTEQQIELLESGLYAVIADNPAFVDYLQEEKKDA